MNYMLMKFWKRRESSLTILLVIVLPVLPVQTMIMTLQITKNSIKKEPEVRVMKVFLNE